MFFINLVELQKISMKNRSPFNPLTHLTLNPLPDDKILDWSKLKQIADDILKCF